MIESLKDLVCPDNRWGSSVVPAEFDVEYHTSLLQVDGHIVA